MKAGLLKFILNYRIKFRKKMMIYTANRFGFTHPTVVIHSQKLDVLLNRYQGIQF